MQRVVIMGSSGAGKSTLARKLGERLGLPVVHLDALFFEPGWVEPETQKFRERVTTALAGDRWVCEGNYLSKTGDLRLPRADTVIWLEQPRWLRLLRVTWRSLRHFGQTRADLAPECPEKIPAELWPFIWTFDREKAPALLAAIAERAPQARLLRLKGNAEVAAFLKSLSSSPARARPAGSP